MQTPVNGLTCAGVDDLLMPLDRHRWHQLRCADINPVYAHELMWCSSSSRLLTTAASFRRERRPRIRARAAGRAAAAAIWWASQLPGVEAIAIPRLPARLYRHCCSGQCCQGYYLKFSAKTLSRTCILATKFSIPTRISSWLNLSNIVYNSSSTATVDSWIRACREL